MIELPMALKGSEWYLGVKFFNSFVCCTVRCLALSIKRDRVVIMVQYCAIEKSSMGFSIKLG